MKRIISVVMIMNWMLMMVVGCGQQSTESYGNNTAEVIGAIESSKPVVIEGVVRAAVLAENLTLVDVTLLADSLENWGYSYRQENSTVFVQNRYRRIVTDDLTGSVPVTNVVDKASPECGYYDQLVGTDTLVWQVFENPERDSSRHTTVVTLIRDGQDLTCLQEFGISESSSEILLIASVNDGMLVRADSGVLAALSDYWKEYIACCGGCAVGCALSGPGYLACVGICCAACAVGAIIMMILDWFF